MLNKLDIKYWLRSGSWQFMQHSRGIVDGGNMLAAYSWRGCPVHYRPGTSDSSIIYNVLLKPGRKAEYWLPPGLSPRTILDIGGNIGIASIYFADRFPHAEIYSFEPVPENFSILSRNIASYPNVRAFQVALGKEAGWVRMSPSGDPLNHGGFSLYEQGGKDRTPTVEVKQARLYLSEIGLSQVDMIKIDTEGSEYDILTALGEDSLSHTQWIMGELHGVRDFELLAYLSQWFDIGVRKDMGRRLFMFHARNKTLR